MFDPRFLLLARDTRIAWWLTTCALLLLAALCPAGAATSSTRGEDIRIPMNAVGAEGVAR